MVWGGSGDDAGPIGFADLTGNGVAEFWGWTPEGWQGQINVYAAVEAIPDLLIGLNSGLSGVWTLTYTTTGEPALSGEQTQLPFALPVVTKVSVDDGNGNVAQTTYAFTGGFYHIAERDFRGFHQSTMVELGDSNNDLTTKTWFHQGNDVALDVNDPNVPDGYLKGAPYRQEVKEGNTLYSRIDTTYEPDDNGLAPFFTPPLQQDRLRCEKVGPCRSTRTKWVYDDYGNVKEEGHFGEVNQGGDERRIARTFLPNESQWIVGCRRRKSAMRA